MGLFDGCLISCDVDDTLIVNNYLPERNIEKINYFVSEGGIFSLATGRTAGAVSSVTEKLDCIGPSVVANGSMIYDFRQDRILYNKCISKEDCSIVKTVINACPDVGIEAHSGKKVLVLNCNQETLDHEKYENLDASPIDYESALSYNWDKVIYMHPSTDGIIKVKNTVCKIRHSSQFVDTSAFIDGRRRYYYEQVPKGVSKASTLKLLCDMLNIKKSCCFAIGDYYNDLEMIKNADIGAALKNSPDEVKNVADMVVCDAKNGAVADFIDYLTEKRKETKNGFNY